MCEPCVHGFMYISELLTLSHPMMPYGVMVSHKLIGIYMGFLVLGVIL